MDAGDPDNDLQAQADVLDKRCGDELDEALRRIGLYHPNKAVMVFPPDDSHRVAAVITVQVGDLALVDRAAEPTIEAADHLDREAETNQFLDARAYWLSRKGGNGAPTDS